MELPVGMLQCLMKHTNHYKYIVICPHPSPVKYELIGVLLLLFFSTLLHSVRYSIMYAPVHIHCKAIFNAVSFLNAVLFIWGSIQYQSHNEFCT